MYKNRIIPCLLIQDESMVKTINFKNPIYLGDPLNIVRIFNEKEVDELILLDIQATKKIQKPNFLLLKEIVSECFMPVCYGGGIKSLSDVKKLLALGIEKVAINSQAIHNPEFINMISNFAGSQSIVVSIDVKKNAKGAYGIYTHSGRKRHHIGPVEFAKKMEKMGAGEIILTSIGLEGTRFGYDIELIEKISSAINIPLIANGGAGKMEDFNKAIKAGASAVAASSMFVLQGVHRAVLISYPNKMEMEKLFNHD